MGNYFSGAETRNRLLEAAMDIFAEYGYRDAKVGDICQRANANVAAVNYHFGGKEQLYLAVVQRAAEEAHAEMPSLDLSVAPEERLRRFIHEFLSNLMESCGSGWRSKLMAREMMDPTDALDVMVERIVLPLSDLLHGIVAEICGADPDSELVSRCAASIMGQCVLYHNNRAIVSRVTGLVFNQEEIASLASHITRFSLAALRSLARDNAGDTDGLNTAPRAASAPIGE